LPPLRERREDIPYLTAAFVRAFSERFGKSVGALTPGAERLLLDAAWHGNVRQLRNVLERACMLAEGEFIAEGDIAPVLERAAPAIVDPPIPIRSVPAPLHEIEREHIIRTLEQVRGNKAVAARLLGISRRAFYRQLERHGLHHRVPMNRPDDGPVAEERPA
jgi:DNA-binding NtrC family response regulator